MDDAAKIRFLCPHCGRALRASNALIGRQLRCPKCSGVVSVPSQNNKAGNKTTKEKVPRSVPHKAKLGSERIKIHCPHCGRGFAAKKSVLGKKYPCPACSKPFVLASPSLKTTKKAALQKRQDEVADEVPKTSDQKTKGNRYIEIEDKEGNLLRYSTVEQIRRDLLAGLITRHNKAREIYPEPKIGLYKFISDEGKRASEFEKAHREWSKVKSWRPIGKGLAKEVDEIRSLYEPLVVSVKSGAMVGFGICTIVAFLVFLVFAIIGALNWDPSKATPDRPFTPGAPGAGATLKALERTPIVSNVIAMFLYGILAFLGGGAVGLVLGYPIGAGIGFLVYLVRKDSYPQPPPDGYIK